MPRARGEAEEDRDELELLLADLADARAQDDGDLFPQCRNKSDPDGALRLLARGGLTDSERDEIHRSAADALYGLEQLERAESMGAVVTGPPSAAAAMRERREQHAEKWRRVLAELEARSEA